MGCVSLPSTLNATVGITSYYCVIQQIMILYHAIKTTQIFFFKQNLVSLKKNKTRIKKQEGCFEKTGFSQP